MATYKYQFVSKPDDALKCLICLEVAEEPWQHGECGKLFCRKCLDKLGNKPCPNCSSKEPQYLSDGKSKREIKALGVKCDNVGRKCEWVGTVSTLSEHMATCKFTEVPCPRLCKKSFMKKDLDEHLQNDCPNRDCKCEFCGLNDTYCRIMSHRIACQKKIIPCHNDGCTMKVQRLRIKEHIATECGHTKVLCKYKGLGCNVELKRKDMLAHELNDLCHVHVAIDSMAELKTDLKVALDKIAKLEKSRFDTTITFHDDLAKRVSKVEAMITTRFATLNETSTTLKIGESMKFKLTEYRKMKEQGKEVFSSLYYIYPKGYHMAIRVVANGLEPGKGTHVSVYLHILKGKHDAQLKWPLIGQVTILLLNQLEDKNHKVAIIDYNSRVNAQIGNSRGCSKFIPHSELVYENIQYLKDDCLYFRASVKVVDFRASVKVVDFKPWLE